MLDLHLAGLGAARPDDDLQRQADQVHRGELGARALVAALGDSFDFDEWGIVLGAFGDKDIAGIVSTIVPAATHVFATAPDSDRAADPDTLADLENPVALPRISVDEPAISVTIGTNSSPLAGKVSGHKLTARMVKSRLDSELVGNVSIKVVDIGRPDAWEVQGRGELALAILVEQMRREGFELTVGKPQVVTRQIDGKLHEPFEAMTIDCPEEFVGAITQLMAARKGRMEEMANHAAGWVRMDFIVPSRGLIGFRTDFLTLTRGTGIANAVFEGYRPWAGEIRARHTGSLVSDRTGSITPFAMIQLADRGQFFVEPGEDTYEGQVVGINPRAEDLDVNVTREKKLTNMRSSTADVMETLARPIELDLEQAMEFCAADECVEVTPEIVRVRKVDLDANTRARNRSRAKAAANNS